MCQSENDLPSSDEFPGNLGLARKLMANGYDVYMLGNPNGIRSADFIATKKNMVYYLEGKTMNGKGSQNELLDKAASQADKIVVDVIGTEDAAITGRQRKLAPLLIAINNFTIFLFITINIVFLQYELLVSKPQRVYR